MSEDVTFDTRKLDKLLKAFGAKLPNAKVGVLGESDSRARGEANSNATVGAAHEFGTSKLPQRSFLRVPITEHMQEKIDSSGAFDKQALNQVISEATLLIWMQKIAILAETIVSEGFDTGGFGKWRPSNMALKKNHQTLVETQQLRNSITSEVKA